MKTHNAKQVVLDAVNKHQFTLNRLTKVRRHEDHDDEISRYLERLAKH